MIEDRARACSFRHGSCRSASLALETFDPPLPRSTKSSTTLLNPSPHRQAPLMPTLAKLLFDPEAQNRMPSAMLPPGPQIGGASRCTDVPATTGRLQHDMIAPDL